MTASASTPLPIARLRLTVRVEAPLHLPPYAGSMLRGAFGHALLALTPLPHEGGKPCALQATCPYCQVFAPPALATHELQKFSQMPAPFVIEPPTDGARRLAAGERFSFGLVLMGRALTHLPALLQAWTHALRRGLGVQHSRCTLVEVVAEQSTQSLLERSAQSAFCAAALPALPSLGTQATLHLTSPLRLQLQGKPALAHNLDARSLLVTLARRWQLLLDMHLGADAPQQDFTRLTAQASTIRLVSEGLQWFDWGRFSQRQQQEMKFGGLLGQLQLHGDLAPFAELLHLGQWLHVGKNTSFGLGGYRLAGLTRPTD